MQGKGNQARIQDEGWLSRKLRMGEVGRLVYGASVSGNVSLLQQLMANDPLTLARAAVTCFNETPLHMAAMLDHLHFAVFLLNHKPDMTTALDSRGRSPLHLASSNGYLHMVDALLSANPDACLIRDEDGRTPLHLAVMKGTETEVVRKLFQARPEVVQFKSHHGETTLHLAVKQNRLGVLKLLLELLGGDQHQAQFLISRDDYGNTLLHTATALKHFEIIKYLLVERSGSAKVNEVNGNGLTALDMIEYMPRDLKQMEIRECLVNAGGLRAGNKSPVSAGVEDQSTDITAGAAAAPLCRRSSIKIRQKREEDWLKKNSNALMVAATVIATMAYQAGLNPPSGVWQEDKKLDNGTMKYYAGTSVMAFKYPRKYAQYMAYNTLCFVAALSIIILLISGLPLKKRIFMWVLMVSMWVTITFMALTYLTSVRAVSPDHEVDDISTVVGISVMVWVGLISIVLLAHTVRFLRWCVRKLRKHRRIENPPSSLA